MLINRKNIICTSILWLGIISMIIVLCFSSMDAAATSEHIIRVPINTTVYLRGRMLGDASVYNTDTLHGRIHDIALSQANAQYKYKEYQIPQDATLNDIKVYDFALQELQAEKSSDEIWDYTGCPKAFENSVTEKVKAAAEIYTKRVYGKIGNGELIKYFKNGSNAYNTIVNSDQATKWGRFLPTSDVNNVLVSEIVPYSDSAFSAKATVTCTKVDDYTEQFDIYMLFQNSKEGWYVTDFTFMK